MHTPGAAGRADVCGPLSAAGPRPPGRAIITMVTRLVQAGTAVGQRLRQLGQQCDHSGGVRTSSYSLSVALMGKLLLWVKH